MKKMLLMLGLILSTAGLMPVAYAGQVDNIMAALMEARENLVAMVDAPDVASQDAYHANITTASQAVDEAVATALADPNTTPEQTAKWEEFRATWEAFKDTRENEIVPQVRAGNVEEAKSVAMGIQAERMATMKSLLVELGAQ